MKRPLRMLLLFEHNIMVANNDPNVINRHYLRCIFTKIAAKVAAKIIPQHNAQ